MTRRASRSQDGQVLAFFAVALPIVLLPVIAYAVDAATVSAHAAGLHAATALAVETASEQLNVGAIRSSGALALDAALAEAVARDTVSAEEPGATTESVSVDRTAVTVMTAEIVAVPFNLFGGPITLHATASARLVPGYDSPSSLLPLPTNTF